jgi:hypothetical protein
MSSKMSKAMKILRAKDRDDRKRAEEMKRRAAERERHRMPGETDEDMEARMRRDLFGFIEMHSER